MLPDDPIGEDVARESSLFGKVVFIIATPGTGAELLVRALGEFPTVAAVPVSTALFSQGMKRVLTMWLHDATDQGLHYLCDPQEFLRAARLLADAPLEAARAALGGDVVVEYTPDHILAIDDIRAIYPDAFVVHVVRDGRHVAQQLARGTDAVPARYAARRWIDDQRGVLEAAVDGTIRIEALLKDPYGALKALADALGFDVPDEALTAAGSHFLGGQPLLEVRRSGRAAAIVEIVGPDLLLHFDYELSSGAGTARAAAWAELAASGAATKGNDLRRKAQYALADRFNWDSWRPAGPLLP